MLQFSRPRRFEVDSSGAGRGTFLLLSHLGSLQKGSLSKYLVIQNEVVFQRFVIFTLLEEMI